MTEYEIGKTEGFLLDTSISLKAKGLMTQILYLPEDCTHSIKGLTTLNKEGTDAIRTGLHELEEYEYLKRKRLRDAQGHLRGIKYNVKLKPVEEGVTTNIDY
jgi:hypothetical protein